MNRHRFIRVYIVPAAVFQSVIVGGGYGTGREVVEFISQYGPVGGLLAIGIVALCFGVILAVSFAFARAFNAYDYRHFFKSLVGRGWIAYEILFIITLLLILAVVGSAAGTVLEDSFGIPDTMGVGIVFAVVVILNFYGRKIVEKSLTIWAVLLTVVIVIYFVMTIAIQGESILRSLSTGEIRKVWWLSGIQFALYNSAIIPAILYCARGIETRREALVSGLFTGLLGAFPALIFHITFMAGYPDILDQELPTYWMIGKLAVPYFLGVYVIILFGTIVQTGVGVLQGFNERLDGWSSDTRGRPLSRPLHALVAASVLLISFVLSSFGIVELVAKGYGSLAWGFLLVYILPILTVGIYKMVNQRND